MFRLFTFIYKVLREVPENLSFVVLLKLVSA